ncbi:hypothetical protein Vadar_021133 [Vaccinium darrowii]|uniref:Uncharacterized protein n=1 Tax=Vaccinium darrowii TaxID=229202 RepID=A0ACB7XB88_9ERIC|nr:hypothetical protein Vadar_021133 [Vaccinium darrowii]
MNFFHDMKKRGYVPSSKLYNSLLNSLALGGEVDEAINLLWEMSKYQKSANLITYQTLLDQICQCQGIGDAKLLLKELQENELVDNHTCWKLLHRLKKNHTGIEM